MKCVSPAFWCIYIIYWRWCYEELCCWISVFDCNCCNVGRICSIVATDTKRISETNNKQTLVFLPTTTVIKNNDNQYFIGSYHYYHAANVQSGVEDWAPGRNDMKNWEGQKWSKKKNVCETDTHAHFFKITCKHIHQKPKTRLKHIVHSHSLPPAHRHTSRRSTSPQHMAHNCTCHPHVGVKYNNQDLGLNKIEPEEEKKPQSKCSNKGRWVPPICHIYLFNWGNTQSTKFVTTVNK